MSYTTQERSPCSKTRHADIHVQVLSKAGIVPSNTATYTSSQITKAISASFGQDPVILCNSNTLYQIYYGFVTNGPLADNAFVPAAINGQSSNCPSTGVKYPLKSGASATSSTKTSTATATSTSAAPTATGTSVSGSGYWNAQYNGKADGCLISSGTWYVGGTCATYKTTTTSKSNDSLINTWDILQNPNNYTQATALP